LGKSVHLNRPGKKHHSGFGLPLTAVTKVDKQKKNIPNLRAFSGFGAVSIQPFVCSDFVLCCSRLFYRRQNSKYFPQCAMCKIVFND